MGNKHQINSTKLCNVSQSEVRDFIFKSLNENRFVPPTVLKGIQLKIRTPLDDKKHTTDTEECNPETDYDEKMEICKRYLEKLIGECRFNQPDIVKLFFRQIVLPTIHQKNSNSAVRVKRFVSQALYDIIPRAEAKNDDWFNCYVDELMNLYHNVTTKESTRFGNVARAILQINEVLRKHTTIHNELDKPIFY